MLGDRVQVLGCFATRGTILLSKGRSSNGLHETHTACYGSQDRREEYVGEKRCEWRYPKAYGHKDSEQKLEAEHKSINYLKQSVPVSFLATATQEQETNERHGYLNTQENPDNLEPVSHFFLCT